MDNPQTTERAALKAIVKAGYSLLCQSNDWNDPWDNGKTGKDFVGCSGHPGCLEEVNQFEKVWEDAITALGLDPKSLAVVVEFDEWIDRA